MTFSIKREKVCAVCPYLLFPLSFLQFIWFGFFYLCCFVLFTSFIALLIYAKLFSLARHSKIERVLVSQIVVLL